MDVLINSMCGILLQFICSHYIVHFQYPTLCQLYHNETEKTFSQIFEEEITPLLYNVFQKIEAEGIFPDSLYEATITLISTKHYKRHKISIITCYDIIS